ncbi:tripartite tricarboxylate transporter permease [Ammoniphilus sp. YIM 78166]|uniref:tripartite tricarboxylate transporter permease n=1 Tax=Ammoniphilus sp. YIM 78166 TaxID=1644106 RepID=UPI0010703147|nr:tripartite tricarboxylate transporter permease [Ammoniphilus sp. YIM 78166]
MLDYILSAFVHIFEWQNLLTMFLGVAVGMIIGALPGLSVTMGVALALPLTFSMPPSAAILLLVGIYCAGTYAGSISAILLNNPGTVASAATAADGFHLAQKGKASFALNISIYASVAGGLISGIVLLLIAPQVAKFSLKFGPPEYFLLALFGLSIIAGVSGKSMSKGLVMACLGLLLATVGLDPIEGVYRFTFGSTFLLSGIDLIPVLIGLFAIAEIFNQVEKGAKSISVNTEYKKEKFGLKEIAPYKKTIFKSSIIGVIVGAIPGTGGAIASFLGYSEAQRTSKDPDSYGKGNPDGVAASEAANNGVTGATLIPMMTLGIPGDTVTAVLLGGLLIQGLNPGPQLFTNYGEIAYTVMVGFLVVNIILFFQAKLAIRLFAKVSAVPTFILLPIVLGFCLVGAFAVNNNMYSVGIALFFGVVGYILPRYGYPITPLLIAIILGPLAEKSLMQALIISNGSYMIFFTRPISLVFILLIVVCTAFTLMRNSKSKKASMGLTPNPSKT